jgi:putative DNA primase/helicase
MAADGFTTCDFIKPEPNANGSMTLPAIRVVTAAEMLTMDMPARKQALDPVLPLPGLAMLYAPRGMGKTYAALSIAHAIASGGTVMKWRAPEPRKVLYCDGEMPAGTLQERLRGIIAGSERQMPGPEYLRFACADLQEHGLPNIARPEAQASLEALMGDAEVLILDNLSTLAHGLRENEADDWDPMQRWLLALRRAGKHVLLIHHAGKRGQQRGTSRHEDAVDTVIGLRRPSDYQPAQGARFEVHLEKARGVVGAEAEPFAAALVKDEDGGLTWEITDLGDAQDSRVKELLREGKSIRKVAKETGISSSSVHRVSQKMGGVAGGGPA